MLLAPASHIIASDFIKLHLLHALLKSLVVSGTIVAAVTGRDNVSRPGVIVYVTVRRTRG